MGSTVAAQQSDLQAAKKQERAAKRKAATALQKLQAAKEAKAGQGPGAASSSDPLSGAATCLPDHGARRPPRS